MRSIAFAVWMAVAGVIVLWQSTQYQGVVAVLGEWQYDALGVYYPTLTCAVLLLLLSLPGYLLFLRPGLRQSSSRLGAGVVRSARAFLRSMLAVAGGLALLVLAVVVAILMLPGADGPTQKIVLDRPMIALPREGPTEIEGAILYDRTVVHNTYEVFTRHSGRYAPIVVPGTQDRDLRFFVELPPVDNATRRGAAAMTGILKRDALPGEVMQLYRYAGYRTEPPLYVLYSDVDALRRPYVVVAIELALATLFVLALAAVQWRRLNRLRNRVHRAPSELIAP